MRSSQDAINLIINEETGGQKYYEAAEIHPDWPGGASGVTIGIGYDCGYSTSDQIFGDWGGHLDDKSVVALSHIAGIHGSPAQALAHELHWISVPWAEAMSVFMQHDVPKWEAIVQSHLPNTDLLSGDSFGALLSLTFNRGSSFDNPLPRYSEMRNIKLYMGTKEFAKIPGEFLSMRRLWPQGGDLWRRRGHEADLFTRGLTA